LRRALRILAQPQIDTAAPPQPLPKTNGRNPGRIAA